MTVLLVVLAVFAVIAAVLSFVLFSPLSVRILYGEELCVIAGLSFIKFKVFPKEQKQKSSKTKKKKKKNAEKNSSSAHAMEKEVQAEGAENQQTKKKKKKGISEILKLVFEIIKGLFDVMGKRAVIKVDRLYVVVSKPDAADTAVAFGICTGIVSNILAFTSNFGKAVIKSENVAVVPDFVSGKGSLKTDITLSVPVYSLLSGLVKGYFKGISRKQVERT